MNNTALFSTKMEPLYPSILSSEPIAGSLYNLYQRLQMFNVSSLPVSSTQLQNDVRRSYVIGPNMPPIIFSNEQSEHPQSRYFYESERELLIKSMK